MPLKTARIGILCPGYGIVARGVETFIGEMTSMLRRLMPGWTFDIYCRARTKEIADGVRLIHVPSVDRETAAASVYAQIGHRLGYFLRTRIDAECLSFTIAAAPKVLATHYDLIFNQAGPFAGNLLRMKRQIDGTPFVHKTASGYGDLELMMARQYPNAIAATSPYAKDWLGKWCPEAAVECIPNAVDCSVFRPYSRSEIEAAGVGLAISKLRKPIVLFVGAMDPMKRPELLMDAMSRIPDASLVMVGSGILSESLSNMGVSALGDRFVYVPRVSREQMPLYYNCCDLFTIPSEEPFGIVFIEAMACNKPVLSHSSPVQKWIFGEAGEMCDCTKPDKYADTIRRMLVNDYGMHPLERSRIFDWSQVTGQYADLFSRVASAGGHADGN